MSQENYIGTYFFQGGRYRRSDGIVARVRDAKGKFVRKIPTMTIMALLAMVAILGIQTFINFHEIDALRHNLENSKADMRVYIARSNQMVLDATLGSIAQIERDRMENSFDTINLVEGSVGLTENLKEQIITKRKTDALNK